ncbi:DinB family protein [Actinomycetospora endophytica]|uniref:DinB family protein n=1 Tax=Actinomycetospora endophytica TaxID=2291215 RepID=A0ABS8P9Q8_9PSEU|nr:DinB family protein [Actinomycetospora endophytica]MCD2195002.1 DinB family protein [Actinomycetospora endophytica]
MNDFDLRGRPEPPMRGDETATLLGFLEFGRATLRWKCAGLDAEGLRTTVGASTITLGGLLGHLAQVEDSWFTEDLAGLPPPPPWDTDREAWRWAADRPPEELLAQWETSVARSRERVAEALADGGLDHLAVDPKPPPAMNLRWILVHMIEEYARHNGHADLLREAADGETGE